MNLDLSLWSDTPRTRFFLIPDDQHSPPGDFVIRTLTGRKQEVDPACLVPFEKTEEEAKEWLESQLGQMLDTARGAVDRFVNHLTGVDADRLAPAHAAAERLQIAIEGIIAPDHRLSADEIAAVHQLAGRLTMLAAQLRTII